MSADKNTLKRAAARMLRRAGLDIVRLGSARHPMGRRQRLLRSYGVDLVLDVGANAGQYGRSLHLLGYRGTIESFEPLGSAYRELARAAAEHAKWNVHNYGLGEDCRRVEMNVSKNSVSSSLLEILPEHLRSAPSSRYVARESVEIRTLDSVFESIDAGYRSIYMKVDTQGSESAVLAGAEASIARIDTVELEMSLVPLYEGQWLFSELHAYMTDRGYRLVSVEPGVSNDESGELLQVDGIYRRDGLG